MVAAAVSEFIMADLRVADVRAFGRDADDVTDDADRRTGVPVAVDVTLLLSAVSGLRLTFLRSVAV